MDSKGHVLVIEDDRVVGRSATPMPDPTRGALVLKALEAAPMLEADPVWWPEMAPLTKKERAFVLKTLRESRPRPAGERQP